MPGLLVLFYNASGAIVTWNTYTYPGGPDGFRDIAVNFVVPADQTIVEMAYELYVPASATVGRAWFGYPTLRQATTGSLIVDGAIDGKTITGALIRSAAIGERTEMTSQGIRHLNSAGQEDVRIGYGIGTGMAVRNPYTGSLVPLSDAAFGTASNAATDSLAYGAPASETPASGGGPGTWSGWTRHSADNCRVVFTAVASKYIIDFSQLWTTDYVASMGASLQPYVVPTVNNVRITNGGYTAAATQIIQANSTKADARAALIAGTVAIATTPGSSYTIEMQFQTSAYSSTTINSQLRNRSLVATPVFT
jgi:hypothetical protein